MGESDKPHYHVAIFVNKDTFNCPGDYSKKAVIRGAMSVRHG
ncbi:hypothetical protein [Citrobacter sedlakii]